MEIINFDHGCDAENSPRGCRDVLTFKSEDFSSVKDNTTYELTLQSVSYASCMGTDHRITFDNLHKLLQVVSVRFSGQMPDGEDLFTAVLDTALRSNHDKLTGLCLLAETNYQEAHELLQTIERPPYCSFNEMMKHAVREYQRPDTQSRISLDISFDNDPQIDDVADDTKSDETNCTLHSENCCSLSSSQCLFTDLNDSISSFNDVSDEGIGRISSLDSSNTSCSIYSGAPDVDDAQQDNKEADLGFEDHCTPSQSIVSDCSRSTSPLSPFSNEPIKQHCTFLDDDGSTATVPTSLASSSIQSPCSQTPNKDSHLKPSHWTKPQTRLPRLIHWPRTSLSRLYKSLSPRIFRKSLASNTGKISFRKSISQPEQKLGHNPPEDVLQISQPHVNIQDPDNLLSSPSVQEDVFILSSPIRNQQLELRSARTINILTWSPENPIGMPEVDKSDLMMTSNQQVISTGSPSSTACSPVPVNTHLHHSPISALTASSADLLLSEAEIKSRRRVSLIMSEIIQTERDYVRALQFITEHYVPELQRDDIPQMLRGKGAVIFGNLEKIYQFHSQYFLKHLETCENQPFLVGQYFLQHETMFYLYALYNKNKPKSDCLMMDYGKQFFREKQLELGDKMDLSSYLLKPVQRMGKYALLLKQLLKECAETETEYPDLKAAEEMVRFQLRHGNDLLAMDSLRNCDVNLEEQGRLLRQEEFLVFQGRKKSMRRIFLFEDLILFSKTKKGQQGQHDIYIYKTSYKTADIGLTENCGSSELKFEIWFRRRSLRETYVLQAANLEMKRAWVKVLSNLLWKQAIHNRKSYIVEQTTMGIGTKPCLDIKPSEDSIQEHSTSVSVANKEAGNRNSFTTSIYDYLKNGNKRPHSIISVSSTSSSASSQSSSGLPGFLNLAFDPLDKNHRSFLADDGIPKHNDAQPDFSFESRNTFYRRTYTGVASFATVRSYFGVMKSRVFRQKHSSKLFSEA